MLFWRGAYTGTAYRELISAIGALKCARQFVPPSTLETQYNSLIRPYLDYYSVVWEGLDSKFSLKLQKLQNRAARIITFSSYDSISAPYSKSLDGTSSLYAEFNRYKCSKCTTIWHLRTYNKKFWKWGPPIIEGAFFLDFNCLFPKPKNVLAIWANFVRKINYSWICVNAGLNGLI